MLIAQPGRMGPLRLRNRIIMGPMGTNFGTTDGFSTERDKLYYGERASGGAAMIITEAMVIHRGARNHTNSMCLFHDRYIPGLAGIVDAIHAGGALAAGQINHRGALLKRSVLGMEPVSASDWHNPNTGEPARAVDPAGNRGDPAGVPRFRAPALPRRLRRSGTPRRQRLPVPAVLLPAHQPPRGPLRRIARKPHALSA